MCKFHSYECLNGGTCVDTGDRVKCLCRQGFSGDLCEVAQNACKDEPCLHGRCKNYGSYYVCQCDRGWIGDKCDQLEKVCNITVDCIGKNTEEVYNYEMNKYLNHHFLFLLSYLFFLLHLDVFAFASLVIMEINVKTI